MPNNSSAEHTKENLTSQFNVLKLALIIDVSSCLPVLAIAILSNSMILLTDIFDYSYNIISGIILNTIFVYLVLKSANWIERKLGDGTLQVLQKVFGIILLAISIKLFTTNFAQLITTYVKF